MLSAMNGVGPPNSSAAGHMPQAVNPGLTEIKQEPALQPSATPMREISDMK